MNQDRFADRLIRETYTDDPVVGIYGTDADDASALWVPERLFLRLTLVARAYELHTLPLLGGPEPVQLTAPMIESLIDELDFVRARLNDDLVWAWADALSARALAALASAEPILTVEGE